MSKKSKPVKLPKHKRVRKGRDALQLVRLDIAHLTARVVDLESTVFKYIDLTSPTPRVLTGTDDD